MDHINQENYLPNLDQVLIVVIFAGVLMIGMIGEKMMDFYVEQMKIVTGLIPVWIVRTMT